MFGVVSNDRRACANCRPIPKSNSWHWVYNERHRLYSAGRRHCHCFSFQGRLMAVGVLDEWINGRTWTGNQSSFVCVRPYVSTANPTGRGYGAAAHRTLSLIGCHAGNERSRERKVQVERSTAPEILYVSAVVKWLRWKVTLFNVSVQRYYT